MECILTGIAGSVAQVFFNAQQLVVLGDAIRARQGSGFDLSGVGGDCEIGDKRIFCLSGSMRDDRGAPVRLRERDTVESFSQRSDLVDFDQYRVGDSEVDSFL